MMTTLKQIVNLTIGIGATVLIIIVIFGIALWLANKLNKNDIQNKKVN
jgi:galactitol-specific phosphotransferase system IIC component